MVEFIENAAYTKIDSTIKGYEYYVNIPIPRNHITAPWEPMYIYLIF